MPELSPWQDVQLYAEQHGEKPDGSISQLSLTLAEFGLTATRWQEAVLESLMPRLRELSQVIRDQEERQARLRRMRHLYRQRRR